MPDQELEILIKTKADLAAAESMLASLKKQKLEAQLLGKDFAELDKQIERVAAHTNAYKQSVADGGAELNDLSEGTKKYIESLKEGGEHSEKFEISQRELHHILGRINPALGESAMIVKKLNTPYVGLALAVGLLVQQMAELQGKINEMVNQPGPDWEKNTKQLEAMRQALAEGQTSLASFSRELETLAHKSILPETFATKAVEQLKKRFDAEGDMLASKQKRDEALIDDAERQGVLNHEQAIAQKLRLDEDYVRRRLAMDEKLRQAEIFERRKEAAAEQGAIYTAKGEIGKSAAAGGTGAQATADRAHEAATRNQSIIDKDKADLDKATEAHGKTLEALGELADEIKNGRTLTAAALAALHAMGLGGLSPKEAMAHLETRSEGEANTISQLRRQLEERTKQAPGLKENADSADAALNELKEKLRALTTRYHELEALIPELKQNAATDAGAGTDKAVSQRQPEIDKAEIGGGYTVQDVDLARQLEATKAHGQKINAAQQQWLTAFETFSQSHITMISNFMSLLSRIQGTQTTAAEKLAAQAELIRQLESRIQNIHNR